MVEPPEIGSQHANGELATTPVNSVEDNKRLVDIQKTLSDKLGNGEKLEENGTRKNSYKPDKVKRFYEKELAVLEQSFITRAKSEHHQRDSNESQLQSQGSLKGTGFNPLLWNHLSEKSRNGYSYDSNPITNYSESNTWNYDIPPVHLVLSSSPPSAFKKKTRDNTPSKKQRVKFDLDVEIHVVPRDSYQPSPADSFDIGLSDADSCASFDNIEEDCSEEHDLKDRYSSISLSKEVYHRDYPNSSITLDAPCDTPAFGKLSIANSPAPFRVISREVAPSGKNFYSSVNAVSSGRRDSIDIVQMQQFLKQQSKERALTSSLPQIIDKKGAKKLSNPWQAYVIPKNGPFKIGKKPSSANGFKFESGSYKNILNSFSLNHSRQIPTYALVQLQKQYQDWERRRKKKKDSLEDLLASSQITNLSNSSQKTQSERTEIPQLEEFDDASKSFEQQNSQTGNSSKTVLSQRNHRTRSASAITMNSSRQSSQEKNQAIVRTSSTDTAFVNAVSPNLLPMTSADSYEKQNVLSNAEKSVNRRLLQNSGAFSSTPSTSTTVGGPLRTYDKPSATKPGGKGVIRSESTPSEEQNAALSKSPTSGTKQKRVFKDGTRSYSATSFSLSKKVLGKKASSQSTVTLKSLGLTVHPPRRQEPRPVLLQNQTTRDGRRNSSISPSSGQIILRSFTTKRSYMKHFLEKNGNSKTALQVSCNRREQDLPVETVQILESNAIT